MSDRQLIDQDHYSGTQAIKASGAIVTLDPYDFARLLKKTEKSLVVMAISGWRKHNYQYISAYKGLIFYTKSKVELSFPSGTELITSKQIWIPS
jgi:hypothetical protein